MVLLWLLPFMRSASTVPLIIWTVSIIQHITYAFAARLVVRVLVPGWVMLWIRIRGSGLCNSRVSPVHTTGCTIYRGANFMKNARRATMILSSAFGCWPFGDRLGTESAIAEQIAKTYGLDHGDKSKRSATLNLDLPHSISTLQDVDVGAQSRPSHL